MEFNPIGTLKNDLRCALCDVRKSWLSEWFSFIHFYVQEVKDRLPQDVGKFTDRQEMNVRGHWSVFWILQCFKLNGTVPFSILGALSLSLFFSPSPFTKHFASFHFFLAAVSAVMFNLRTSPPVQWVKQAEWQFNLCCRIKQFAPPPHSLLFTYRWGLRQIHLLLNQPQLSSGSFKISPCHNPPCCLWVRSNSVHPENPKQTVDKLCLRTSRRTRLLLESFNTLWLAARSTTDSSVFCTMRRTFKEGGGHRSYFFNP